VAKDYGEEVDVWFEGHEVYIRFQSPASILPEHAA
jgi:hypothetical protein